MNKIISIAAIVALTAVFSFSQEGINSAPLKQSDFYGEWGGGESGIVTIISADAVKNIWMIEVVTQIQKWEPVKNLNRATNASYPDGYKLRTKNKDGKIVNIFLWRHSNNIDRIRFQSEAGFLEKGGGEGDIISRVKNPLH